MFQLFFTLKFRAPHIFSEFSLALKACFALRSAIKWPANILLVFVCIYAGDLSIQIEGIFGFCPRASWNG